MIICASFVEMEYELQELETDAIRIDEIEKEKERIESLSKEKGEVRSRMERVQRDIARILRAAAVRLNVHICFDQIVASDGAAVIL